MSYIMGHCSAFAYLVPQVGGLVKQSSDSPGTKVSRHKVDAGSFVKNCCNTRLTAELYPNGSSLAAGLEAVSRMKFDSEELCAPIRLAFDSTVGRPLVWGS